MKRAGAVSVLIGLALVAALAPPGVAVVPGANGKIAFTSDRDGNAEIYVMNADGSGQTRLTSSGGADFWPSWSPDGTRIAFTSDRDGNAEIYVMNADGSGQTRLTSNPADDSSPTWSPDGTRIAFDSRRDGQTEIYVMNADGSGQTRLTVDGAGDFSPSWSPDGTRIAFTSNRDGAENTEIYVMNADGSGQTRLTVNGKFDFDDLPSWSPDGTRIAFVSIRDGQTEIYVMNADGSGQTRLTSNPAGDSFPTWSPDGTRIAFTSDRDGKYQIYVMNADGSGPTRLTSSAAVDQDPSWQPIRPTIASFTPTSGPVGTSVTITGANLSPFTSVTFGGTAAGVTSSSPTQIVATVPEGAVTGPIVVTTPIGTAASATDFTVTGVEHPRSLSLRVGRKARGMLTVDDGYSACAQGVPVKVQRREDGRWKLIGTDRTSDTGRYVVPGEFGPGRYRALAKRVILPSSDVCLRAVSRTVRV